MRYEYDPAKSQNNKSKHGIDFEEAQELWKDDNLLEITAHFRDERRFAVIGRIHEIMWTVVCTMRGESIRIISCRRSRKTEIALYDQAIEKLHNG